MKLLIVLTIACAIAFPANAFLLDTLSNAINSITSSVGNAITSVTNTVTNVVDTVGTVIDTVQTGTQFLWDNAFGPSLQLAIDNGSIWIDDYFGSILNSIGKRGASLNDFHTLYDIETSQLLSKLEVVYHQFVETTEKILEATALGLLGGSLDAGSLISGIVGKFEDLVDDMMKNTIHSLTVPLSAFGPISSQIMSELTAKITKIGSTFKIQLNLLATSIIDKVDFNLQHVFKPKF